MSSTPLVSRAVGRFSAPRELTASGVCADMVCAEMLGPDAEQPYPVTATRAASNAAIPSVSRFRPHPLVLGGHLQTLMAYFLPWQPPVYEATRHEVQLPDGDRLIMHDDCPLQWKRGDRAVLLIHGIAGCHQSPYLVRLATKLKDRGIRAFRLDLRGCGAGLGLARSLYHSGRSEDAAAAIETIGRICPESPVTLIGFSLGGNITLKLLGEVGQRPPGHLDSAAAINPPIDLSTCVAAMRRPLNRYYETYFVNLLMQQVAARDQALAGEAPIQLARKPKSLREFDERVTAPLCGFGTADNYYRVASSGPLLKQIELPTLVLASRDDPLVPVSMFDAVQISRAVKLEITRHGGHLGFISSRSSAPDRRWMDWRLVDWVEDQPLRR